VRAVTQTRTEPTAAEILSLLRDPSQDPESVASKCGPCSPEQIGRTRELLTRIGAEQTAAGAGLEPEGAASFEQVAREVGSLPEPLAFAVVRAASEGKRSPLLAQIAALGPKAIAKEAKRELQHLKQMGVQVQEVRPKGEPVMKPVPPTEAPPCLVSSIDAYGERGVWWTRPSQGGGVDVVQAVVSDVKGVLAIDAFSLPRRNFREFLRKLPRGGMVTVIEVPKDYARHLIAAAEEEGVRNGFSPPPSYTEALQILGPAPLTPPRSPSELIDLPGDKEAELAAQGGTLFSDPLFSAWIPEEEELRGFVLKLDEIAVSQLYISDEQKKEAMYQAASDAGDAYFTAQRRTRYAKRLFEMALVLRMENRVEPARIALAVSRALGRDDPAGKSFGRGLFVHALEQRFARGRQPPRPASSGLIQPP
jgi:hypothetical protein